MAEHPNVQHARAAFAAFAAGDAAALRERFAADAVWRVPGRNAMAGEHVGLEAVFAFLRRTAELTGGTYRAELQYAVADDEHIVAVYRATGLRDGGALDITQAVFVRIDERGRWTEIQAVPFDQHAFDAFWA